MVVTKELEMTIANEMALIKAMEVVYYSGDILIGFISSVSFFPLRVTFCESEVPRGKNPYHYLNFDDISKITILYHDGRVVLF